MITLELLIAVPLVGAALCLAAGRFSDALPRYVALLATLVTAGLVVTLLPELARGDGVIEGWRVAKDTLPFWDLRLDGLSAPLLALTALLGPVAILASWRERERPAAHHALLLGLLSAIFGVFLAADVILLYVFWEAVLIPMFFLIGVWGHENRRHAAMKFFIYTFSGSVLMFVGILIAVMSIGTTNIESLSAGRVMLGEPALVFWLLAIGVLVKVPAVPFHTWLADAHVEAPTAGSILLAGVLLKMGGYGLFRLVIPVAPDVFDDVRWIFAILGIVGIVYGASLALVQTDLKRLVALSSVAHMGFVLLGVSTGTVLGYAGAMLVMVSHGVVAPMLFLLVGQLYERTHTRDIARFGGLGSTVPRWGGAFTFGALASLGLPGLSGFPGEFLTIIEGFGAWRWWIVPAAFGVLLAGAYNLRAVREVVHGEVAPEWRSVDDLRALDLVPVGILAAVIVILGVWPTFVLTMTGESFAAIVALAGGGF